MKLFKNTIFSLITLFCVLFGQSVLAAVDHPEFKDTGYEAQYVSQSVSDPVQMTAGSTKTVVVNFINKGDETWSSQSGYGYVTVYTFNDKYRVSKFSSNSWLAANQPAKLYNETKPGETGKFIINLTAPSQVGTYKEEFYLASENNSWIKGGYFYLQINVGAKTNNIVANTKTDSSASNVTKTVSQPEQSITVANYTFKNYLDLYNRGEEVEQLQKVLKEHGYYDYPEITGYYGSVTKEAVIKFQKAKGLSPYPGYVGPGTRKELNKLVETVVPVKSATTPATTVLSTEKNEIKAVKSEILKQVQDDSVKVQPKLKGKTIFATSQHMMSKGGQFENYVFIVENIGSQNWDGVDLRLKGLYLENGRTAQEVSIADSSWLTDQRIANLSTVINTSSPAVFQFAFRAPAKKGKYTAKFQLSTQGKAIIGSELILPLDIVTDAPISYSVPSLPKDSQTRALLEEPKIKVGLYQANETVQFISAFDYMVYTGETYEGILPAQDVAKVSYSSGEYSLLSKQKTVISKEYIKLIPVKDDAYFELLNYTRKVSWRPDLNYNKYRGSMIFKFSPGKQVPYVVNELHLSDYIAGIAETDNASHLEYIKAILVAARSYAYFNINYGLPPEKRTFDVYGSTVDQLYLGYNSEMVMPRVAQAARDTYGEMVTYQGEPITTPYFGNSDGSTRTWSEVWGGADKPWLKRVEAKYDIGKAMYGHGVGMSARDASFRAVKDGWGYEQILRYYYTDVEVEQIY